jgi:virulence-associated protein VapD
MFAIAFDLVVAEAEKSHTKGVSQACADIGQIEDMAHLFSALMALRAMSWFPATVRDIRAFRLEQWSDFTKLMKQPETQASKL